MATGDERDAPDRRDVRAAALEGAIASLEAELQTAESDAERRAIAAELARRRRALERLRDDG